MAVLWQRRQKKRNAGIILLGSLLLLGLAELIGIDA
jgi:hypothetical protein